MPALRQLKDVQVGADNRPLKSLNPHKVTGRVLQGYFKITIAIL